MKYVGYGLLMILGLALQTSGSPGLMLFGFKPELMLLLTLLFAMLQNRDGGPMFGFFSGLLQDLLIGHFIGLHAGTFMLTAILVGFVTRRFYKENFLVRFFAVFGGTVVGQVLYLLGAASFGVSSSWSLGTWSTILATSVLNGLIGMILFRPLASLNKRLVYLDELLKRTG